MCTVIYLPKKNGDFIFASSRDEHRDRPSAHPPTTKKFLEKTIVYPKDPVGKGSWIVGYEDMGLCIMNGAYRAHQRRLPYRYSRGLIPFRYIHCSENGGNFMDDVKLEGIEAFTLIVADNKSIREYRWDEDSLDLHTFSRSEPKIWASAPLYSSEMLKERRKWFGDFLKNNHLPSPRDVYNFYTNGGSGDPHSGLIINRKNGVKTVSISCLEVRDKNIEMHYWAL